jgi:hypothetical protein
MLAGALVLGGCVGPSASDDKAACFQNIVLLRTEMRLFNGDTGGMDAPFPSVVAKLHVVCPSGGKYSYDSATGVVTCSIHGHP